MTQDLQYGWRQLRNAPVFTVTAVLSLALGISASVTMFSAFRAVFLRPLIYRDPGQLVRVAKLTTNSYTPANYFDDIAFLRKYDRSLESTANFGFFETATLSGIPDPVDLWIRGVSKEFFPLLGAKPELGRTFEPFDFQPGAPQTVVFADETWQKYFHGNPRIIGAQVFLNGQASTVVGAMPREFAFPQAGVAAWTADPTLPTADTAVNTVARLRPGVSLKQAQQEIEQLTPALRAKYPAADRDFKLWLEPVATEGVQEYRRAFLLLLGAADFLALLACLNVANLLLARAAARRNEFLVRRALGAGRARLIGQVLTESLVLAGLSGIAGVALAYMGNHVLLWLLPAHFGVPRLGETRMDVEVLGYSVALTFATAILFGLAPAFAFSGTLTESDRQGRSSPANSWRNSVMLMGQIAVALILFSGSILMIRGFVRLANVNPGFRADHLFTATVPPGQLSRLNRTQLAQRYSQLLRVAQTTPGVEKAALTGYVPFGRIVVQLQVFVPAKGSAPDQFEFHAVSADYFSILHIPLLRGRLFDRLNPTSTPGAIVINRAMAEKLWPGRNPIGQHLSGKPAPAPPDLTVIGVVGNTQHRSLGGEPVPEFYEPYEQYLGPAVGTTLVLQTMADPKTTEFALRQAIHRFDANQVVEQVRTMDTAVNQSIAKPRFYTVLLGVFALLALLLTLMGVYGVASYGVSQRMREFGIRMAVGADRQQLIGMILQQGFWRGVTGVVAGEICAWALADVMSGLVYGISVRDPVSLTVAGVVLIAGALTAYYLPARRSTNIDPAVVLRQE